MVRCYMGEYVRFCNGIERGCVGTGDNKLVSLCELKEGTLLQGRVSYVLYVY